MMIEKFFLLKKNGYKYNLGLKNHLLTLDNYLLPCGGGDGGTVGGGGGSGDSGSSSGCGGCDYYLLLLIYYFIVANILFYCDVHIILLC